MSSHDNNELKALEKAVALQNSRPLNLQYKLDATPLAQLLRQIYKEVGIQGAGKNKRKNRRHIKVLITDLIRSYQEDPAQYLGLSLSSNDYAVKGRYNNLSVSYRRIKAALTLLEKHGYIEFNKGFYDRRINKGACTRIRATDRLASQVTSNMPHIGIACMPNDYEPIILREGPPNDPEAKKEGSGKAIEYPETAETIKMRKFVRGYVSLLHEHVITNPRDKRHWDRYPIDRRVFNNGRWDNGGRHYGGNWQNCQRELRPFILIDGEPTVEIDYVALHACLAYARKGIGWWETVQDSHDLLQDPYRMAGHLTDKDWRLFYKKALNIALSASSVDSTLYALNNIIQKDVYKRIGEYPKELSVWSVLNKELQAFLGEEGRHAEISDLFFKGEGLKLQYLDSQIAEAIFKAFMEQGKVVLGIHDSFIVKKSDEELLKEVMALSYQRIVGFSPRFK